VSDRAILIAGAFTRAVAIGFTAVVLGLHLASHGLDERTIGVVVAAGLAGAAASATAVTFIGDRLSRRVWMLGCSLLSAVGTALVAVSEIPAVVVAAAFLGMLNGMGRDRGALPVLEQAALPATTSDRERTRAFAVYALAQDIGHGLGALLAAAPELVARHAALGDGDTLRGAMLAIALVHAALALLYGRLSPRVEAPSTVPVRLSPATRRTVSRISALFLLDALGGGFLSGALLTLFFVERFDASTTAVAVLFALSRVLNALSHLGAAWLARRIGLVRTMVLTHLPSSLLLITVAYAPSFPVAGLLFLLREGLVEMDVPTRQSYVMAVVAPAERTRVAGITQLVRLAGWAIGPLIAGALLADDRIVIPLVIAAVLKITYDLLLFAAFRAVRPPEERSIAPG
jgi:MFS family permease